MSASFVFTTMGTMVSLQAAEPLPREAEDAVLTAFVEYDERFSLWKPESEGARFARREISLAETSDAFTDVYNQAVSWRLATGGAFTPHRPDGQVDLSGIVKALAIAAAGDALEALGVPNWCLNAGGDVLTEGTQADGSPWVVGIVDPQDRQQLFSQFETRSGRRAVATSGTAERGEHVWRIGADDTFVQVTVCAEDIVTADVLATAILAGGPALITRSEELADIDVLACTASDRIWASAAFRKGVTLQPVA